MVANPSLQKEFHSLQTDIKTNNNNKNFSHYNVRFKSLTECNGGTTQKLPVSSKFYDWAQKHTNTTSDNIGTLNSWKWLH